MASVNQQFLPPYLHDFDEIIVTNKTIQILKDYFEYNNLQQIKSNYNIKDYISNENETNENRKSINSRNILIYNILKNNYNYEDKYDQCKELYEK